MTSVERIIEICEKLESEGQYESYPSEKPPKTWPDKGQIVFKNVSLNYTESDIDQLALKNLDFNIDPGMRVKKFHK